MSASDKDVTSPPSRARSGKSTQVDSKYARKQQAIIAAASEVINRDGVKGMTLANVAARVGLITTSVTYYFRKKEDLAVACFRDAISRVEALVDAADVHGTGGDVHDIEHRAALAVARRGERRQ